MALGRKAIPFVFSRIRAKLAFRKVQLMEASEQKQYLSLGSQTPSYELKAFLLVCQQTASKNPKAIPFYLKLNTWLTLKSFDKRIVYGRWPILPRPLRKLAHRNQFALLGLLDNVRTFIVLIELVDRKKPSICWALYFQSTDSILSVIFQQLFEGH